MDEAKDLTTLVMQICIGLVNIIGAIFAGLAMLKSTKAVASSASAAINAATAARAASEARDDVVVVKDDLKVVKKQTDGMAKIMAQQAEQIGIAKGKEIGAASEIMTGKEAFAAGQEVGKASEQKKLNGESPC